jgi:DNA adenine methylase Dam
MSDYLKSAFNYTGQKYPLLEQLLEYFPVKQDVDLFVDAFCGGGSVFVNCDYDKIIANDRITPLINFYNEINNTETFEELKSNIEPYILDKEDKEAYHESRDKFNEEGAENPFHFFCLVQSCTNNMMRFNKKFQFNQTFGKRTYNPNTEEKLKAYYERIRTQNVKFSNLNYTDLFDKLLKYDEGEMFIYIDPPYYGITEAGYNAFWSKQLEEMLYDYIEKIDKNGFKFALSGVSEHKGQKNPFFDKLNKYKIINLEHDYNKVSRKKNVGKTQEILVINY